MQKKPPFLWISSFSSKSLVSVQPLYWLKHLHEFWAHLWGQCALPPHPVTSFSFSLAQDLFQQTFQRPGRHRLPGNSPFFCLEHNNTGLDLAQGPVRLDQQITPKLIETRCAYPPLQRDVVVLSTWLDDLYENFRFLEEGKAFGTNRMAYLDPHGEASYHL